MEARPRPVTRRSAEGEASFWVTRRRPKTGHTHLRPHGTAPEDRERSEKARCPEMGGTGTGKKGSQLPMYRPICWLLLDSGSFSWAPGQDLLTSGVMLIFLHHFCAKKRKGYHLPHLSRVRTRLASCGNSASCPEDRTEEMSRGSKQCTRHVEL